MEAKKWSKKYKKSIDCSNPKGFSQRAHCRGRIRKLNEEKADMPCNKPRPSTSAGKKMMVKACEGGQEKLVHFGAKGYGHNYSEAARKSFRARHKCGEKKSKLSAQYWACKKLWAGPKGSKAPCPSNRQCKECYELEINNLIKEQSMKELTPKRREKRRKIVKALMDQYPKSKAYAIATSQVMKEDLVNEEIVNPDNKGTMTKAELISRDSKARNSKVTKNIRAIKGNDTDENAKYRYATYLQIRMRGGKKSPKKATKAKKSKKTTKAKKSKELPAAQNKTVRTAMDRIAQQREALRKNK